ncbi:MAG: hypothetical protein JO250_08375 [Armatimonadetes bacterium]|nr:hypothetical protein [Armatimonadota bacterium]
MNARHGVALSGSCSARNVGRPHTSYLTPNAQRIMPTFSRTRPPSTIGATWCPPGGWESKNSPFQAARTGPRPRSLRYFVTAPTPRAQG